jgi:hypothetical protein
LERLEGTLGADAVPGRIALLIWGFGINRFEVLTLPFPLSNAFNGGTGAGVNAGVGAGLDLPSSLGMTRELGTESVTGGEAGAISTTEFTRGGKGEVSIGISALNVEWGTTSGTDAV